MIPQKCHRRCQDRYFAFHGPAAWCARVRLAESDHTDSCGYGPRSSKGAKWPEKEIDEEGTGCVHQILSTHHFTSLPRPQHDVCYCFCVLLLGTSLMLQLLKGSLKCPWLVLWFPFKKLKRPKINWRGHPSATLQPSLQGLWLCSEALQLWISGIIFYSYVKSVFHYLQGYS